MYMKCMHELNARLKMYVTIICIMNTYKLNRLDSEKFLQSSLKQSLFFFFNIYVIKEVN